MIEASTLQGRESPLDDPEAGVTSRLLDLLLENVDGASGDHDRQ
jgi:hypothetical protein